MNTHVYTDPLTTSSFCLQLRIAQEETLPQTDSTAAPAASQRKEKETPALLPFLQASENMFSSGLTHTQQNKARVR